MHFNPSAIVFSVLLTFSTSLFFAYFRACCCSLSLSRYGVFGAVLWQCVMFALLLIPLPMCMLNKNGNINDKVVGTLVGGQRHVMSL